MLNFFFTTIVYFNRKTIVLYANRSENTPLEGQFENSFEQPYHNVKISE
jgi:alpha-glucosidase